jgi:glycerol-3-phosphate acyltransferase PlsX
VFKRLKHKIDPRSYAGATFLGLRGFAFKTHGNSDALAFANSIKYAAGLTKANLNGLIEERARALADVRAQISAAEETEK